MRTVITEITESVYSLEEANSALLHNNVEELIYKVQCIQLSIQHSTCTPSGSQKKTVSEIYLLLPRYSLKGVLHNI